MIQVQGLSKLYYVGAPQGYRTVREALVEAALAPWRRLRSFGQSPSGPDSTIWALRDVDLEVQPGEVVGLIGRNGAGKSTLLKILSRVTEPTRGQAVLRGRVGSLLEVGTGFHPELTGRENIYLSGAILGMSRREIRAKFDQIVEFSGIGKFIDTPVKRYSSGMPVRLGFAVAAHLEPEILLVDEVLAVGDFEFQRKCLGKMGEVSRGGRTIIFVSHNMAAVDALCTRCILLQEGCVAAMGSPSSVIARYLESHVHGTGRVELHRHAARLPRYAPVARCFRIINASGAVAGSVGLGEPARFEVDLEPASPLTALGVGIHIYNATGCRVATYHSRHQCPRSLSAHGPVTVACSLPRCQLLPGSYSLVLSVVSGTQEVDRIEHFTSLEVSPRDLYGTGRIPTPPDGFFAPEGQWEVTPNHPAAPAPSCACTAWQENSGTP